MSDTHDPLVTGGGLLAQSALAARERQRLLTDRFGDYQAAGHLGEGGMAVVLKGRRADGQFEKSVAIKVLGRSAGKDFEARTRQEIQILADLNHPGIVPLLDAGVSEQGYSYLVMDLIEGVRIDQWKAPSSTTLKDIVERVAQVADALAHAHRSLVVHGDLKPSNILVTDAGEPKLLDFGVSAVLSAEGGPDADEGTVARALTPAYASPEQLKGAKMTPASDIYQLGMLLDTLLAGSPAYAGENYAEAVQRAQTPAELPGLNQRIVDRQLAARVRGDLQAIIYRCCREAPSARYGSADAVARDLRAFLGGYSVEARPLAAGARAWRFANRHRIPVAICALSLLTLILATAGYVQRIEQQHEVATAAALKAQRLNATLRGVIGAASPLELGAASEETQLLLAQTSRRIQTLLAGEQDLLPELLQTLAGAQIQMGSFAAAEDNLRQALTAAENSTANPLTIAAIQGELGRLATLDEDWARAEELLESAWSGLGEAPDAAPEEKVTVLMHRAALRHRVGELAKGLEDLEYASELIEASATADQSIHGQIDTQRAAILNDQNRPTQALPLAQGALDTLQAAHGYDHPMLLGTMNVLAVSLGRLGRDQDAGDMLLKAIAITTDAVGQRSDLLHKMYINLSVSRYRLRRYDDALAALGQAEKVSVGNAVASIHIETSRANIYNRIGRFEEALGVLMQAERTANNAGLSQSEFMGRLNNNLGHSYLEQGHFDEAITALRAAVDLKSKTAGPLARTTASSRLRLAAALAGAGMQNEAEAALSDAWETYQPDKEGGAVRAPLPLRIKGQLAMAANDLDPALKWLNAALQEARTRRTGPHESIAVSLLQLGQCYWQRGEPSVAQSHLREALSQYDSLDQKSVGYVEAKVLLARLAVAGHGPVPSTTELEYLHDQYLRQLPQRRDLAEHWAVVLAAVQKF